MKNNKLQIKIMGVTGAGKSALAWGISDFLTKNGILHRISGCEDEEEGVLDKTWEKRLAALKNKAFVEIQTIQLNRSAEICQSKN